MSDKKLALPSWFALIAGALLAGPAAAHHSFAPYDDKNPVTIEGTLKEIKFANPHVGVVVVAMKDGKETTYSIHGRSPAEWRREGWKPSDFKVGDKVNVIGSRAAITGSRLRSRPSRACPTENTSALRRSRSNRPEL